MKHLFNLTLILTVFLFACGETEKNTEETTQSTMTETSTDEQETIPTSFVCEEINFESSQNWGNEIQKAYQNATDSTRTDQIEWEQKLFCLFPKFVFGGRCKDNSQWNHL